MTPEEAAKLLLDREGASPGSFPPAAVTRARSLIGSGGSVTLPEQKIEGTPMSFLEANVTGKSYPEEAEWKALDAPMSPLLERAKGLVPKAVEGLYTGLDRAVSAGSSGLTDAAGLTGPKNPRLAQVLSEYPNAAKLGSGLGTLFSPIGKAVSWLAGAGLARAAPNLAGSALGRIAGAGVEAGAGAGAMSGIQAASEGKGAEDVARETATGAGYGAAFGAGLQGTIGEGARALRGSIRSKFPEIAQAEAGGAKPSILHGIVPGEEQVAATRVAEAQGLHPVDYQADLLTAPVMQSGRQSMKDLNARIGSENRAYGATPEGSTPKAATKLLDALTAEHAANVDAGGKPLAGAGSKLSFLRENINNLAELEFVEAGGRTPPGATRMSYRDAVQRGFDVDGAAKAQLEHADAAPGYDVIITPKKYTAEQALQTIGNMDERLKAARNPQGPNIGISGKIDAAAHQLKENYPGLPELRASQAAVKGPLTEQLDMAGVADPSDKAFVGAEDKKRLFQSLRGMGDTGRIPAQDKALGAIAGQAGVSKQLQLMQSLKALERLKGDTLLPFQVRPSGALGLTLPKRAIGLRADPLLELLMGTPVPMGRAFGEGERQQ